MGALKGGVAKTHTTMLWAFICALTGEQVFVADCDPVNSSCMKWSAMAMKRGIWPRNIRVVSYTDEHLIPRVTSDTVGCRHVLLDMAPGDAAQLRRAWELSEYAIFPIQQLPGDVPQLVTTFNERSMMATPIDAHVLLSRTDRRAPRQLQDARNFIAGRGWPHFRSDVPHRVEYSEHFGKLPDWFGEFAHPLGELVGVSLPAAEEEYLEKAEAW
jgi:cellulose biosynthesis protein BcsQ